jgi:hypothetical protein
MDPATHLSLARLAASCAALAGLGFTMGFSPTLYDVALHTLEKSARPARDLRALCGGVLAGAILLLIIFGSFDPDTIIALFRGKLEALAVDAVVDVIAGALFCAAAGSVMLHHPKPRVHHAVGLDSTRRLSITGFLGLVVSVSSVATAYLAGRTVTGSTTMIAARAAEYVFFLAFVVGPYLLVGLAWGHSPALERVVRAAQQRISRFDFRPLLAAALLVAGCVSLAFGVHGLLAG